MKQFRSIEQLDTAILYVLELTSSISVLLLAFGLVASMANVLTKGSVAPSAIIRKVNGSNTCCMDCSQPSCFLQLPLSALLRVYSKP